MVNKPKNIGTAAETAVKKYLIENGFPFAERRAMRGKFDPGDITGCPGLCFEVKAGEAAMTADDRTIAGWLVETENERKNSKSDFGILVVRRRGKAKAGDWWAYMNATDFALLFPFDEGPIIQERFPVRCLFSDIVKLLRKIGYGNPI